MHYVSDLLVLVVSEELQSDCPIMLLRHFVMEPQGREIDDVEGQSFLGELLTCCSGQVQETYLPLM